MSGIPAAVYQNANPFTNFNRLGGFDEYEGDDQHHQHHAAAASSPEHVASVGAAMAMHSPADRQEAMQRLSPGSGGSGSVLGSPAPTTLPGGAASLDELLSRAAALDRECFDLQNEVNRWERDLGECQGDIERVAVSCKRYASELGQVEHSVEELNKWFQEHTCYNEPERYDRVRDLNQDVCSLNMRISSLEQQLDTLLQGTLTTTNLSPARSGGGPEGLNNDDDDTQRIADMLNHISDISGGGEHQTPPRKSEHDRSGSASGNNNNNTNTSHLVAVASPARLPSNASSQHLKKYISELEQKTLEQDVRIMRLREGSDKRDRLLKQERDNELEIQHLRNKLEQAGIELPMAPIQHRTSRALRRNQALGAAAGANASSSSDGSPSSGAHVALAGGSDVSRRTVRLPSGILRELTKELQASVRQVAHRCGVGEIAVEIASDATLLHCRGVLRAVNSFEAEVTAAADRCKRQRALGGLVTYAVPEVAAVIAQSTDKIANLLQPSTEEQHVQAHADDAGDVRDASRQQQQERA